MEDYSNASIDKLIATVAEYAPNADTTMIRLAYDFADRAHAGQVRKSGEPYIIHPLAAAQILAEMRIDPIIVTATLLHDVPEDTPMTLDDIERNFGSEITSLVRGITKLGKLKYRGVERYIENLRKMFVAMAEDVRVMIIKFADRIHNLTTLDALPAPKRYRIALESLEIYAPIAGRLGIEEMKGRLEDLAFRFIHPKEYAEVKEIRNKRLTGHETYIENVISSARAELQNSGIKILAINGRNKRLFSCYQKLVKKNNEPQIYDLMAIRVIVPSVAECYATLGIIHKIWKPIRGRIKDYISQPKPNGYQSLHTTILDEAGEAIEFQIRTQDMHDEAEFGIAAHWHYDENGSRRPAREITWAKELAEIQKDILNNLSDLESIKVDFLQSRIFVFTPKGDVIDLPEGSTPVDFAYHIHTDIGDRCSGAKINNQIAPLNAELKNGDMVEIIVDKGRKSPNRDWLDFVKTQTAKSRIQRFQKNRLTDWIKNVLPGSKK